MAPLRLTALLRGTEALDWDAVYREQLPRVYNYFFYRVGDDQLAEDLCATTFEKAWRHRQHYRHDVAGFSTWLLSIARNVAIDHFRQRRSLLPLERAATEVVAAPLEELVEERSNRRRLAALLARQPERDRELIALKYGSGLTNRAIAELMGLSESNVGTTLHRLVQRLRLQWEDEHEH